MCCTPPPGPGAEMRPGQASTPLSGDSPGPDGFGLERADLLGLRALRASPGGELDPLVLRKAAETVGLDGRVVNEDVGGAVVGGNEAVTLVGVEPLHDALSHVCYSC